MFFGKANLNDLSSLINLRIAYLLEDYGELPENQIKQITDNLSSYFEKHLNNDLLVFVCRDVDKIVSCCFLCITEKPSNPSFINGRTGTILNVYTLPKYRRKGIAGKLIKMLLDEAETSKLDFVELKATDSGYSLYKSLGFEDVLSKYHNMKFVFDSSNNQ